MVVEVFAAGFAAGEVSAVIGYKGFKGPSQNLLFLNHHLSLQCSKTQLSDSLASHQSKHLSKEAATFPHHITYLSTLLYPSKDTPS